jgi:hypothetical protein
MEGVGDREIKSARFARGAGESDLRNSTLTRGVDEDEFSTGLKFCEMRRNSVYAKRAYGGDGNRSEKT